MPLRPTPCEVDGALQKHGFQMYRRTSPSSDERAAIPKCGLLFFRNRAVFRGSVIFVSSADPPIHSGRDRGWFANGWEEGPIYTCMCARVLDEEQSCAVLLRAASSSLKKRCVDERCTMQEAVERK